MLVMASRIHPRQTASIIRMRHAGVHLVLVSCIGLNDGLETAAGM